MFHKLFNLAHDLKALTPSNKFGHIDVNVAWKMCDSFEYFSF